MFAENLDDFLDVAAHAVQATVAGVPVNGIFSNRAGEALFAAGSSPVLTCKSSDVAATARGTAVVVNATNYTVARIEPDGTGLSRVLLEKT